LNNGDGLIPGRPFVELAKRASRDCARTLFPFPVSAPDFRLGGEYITFDAARNMSFLSRLPKAAPLTNFS
jgi:hypothetical protein